MKIDYSIERSTDAAVELFTTALAKSFGKIETDADDTLIGEMIKAARQMAENYYNRALITQSWTMILDEMPELIPLPQGYIQSITSVNVIAEDDTATPQSADTIYHSQVTSEAGQIWLRSGATWTTTTRAYGLMEVVYVAGYGDAAIDVPPGIILGVKALFTQLYELRQFNLPKEDIIKALPPEFKIHSL